VTYDPAPFSPSEGPHIAPSAPHPEDDTERLTMLVDMWYAVVGRLKGSRSLQLTIQLTYAGAPLTLHLYSNEISGELFFLLLESWLRGDISSLTLEPRD
jgi:hypothetical protein